MHILLFLLIASFYSHGKVETKLTRWNKLMILVGQEMKLLEKAKKKGVEIKYRMLELHSEKLKLIHEKNNREFMEKSKLTGTGKDKEKYFNETKAYYNLTKEFGFKILKEEVKNSRKAEIMFAMALNSRDYGRDNITEKYLLEVIDLVSKPKDSLRHHAETALADYYYNEKRFPEAITYYQKVIKNTEDDWMTKHLFNLSWCYLKNRDFDNAILTIKKSYFVSQDKAYVNIKDQVLENIGSFYVYAGRPLEGLEFYLENEKDPLPFIMPMALKSSAKGHEKETKIILDAAQKVIDKNQLFQHQEELLHTYLDFYRHYNRFIDHEKISEIMVSYYSKAPKPHRSDKAANPKFELKDDAIEKMRSLAGFLQVKLAKDVKKDQSVFNETELAIVLKYFSHLIKLDTKRKVEYLYFQAETYFSVNVYKSAASSYVEAINEARKVKHDELSRKSLNSLLALTGLEVLEKNENTKYLIFAYSHHVKFWPRDEKSEQIYPKLFNIYREASDDVRATNVLATYYDAYPEHIKEQQASMTKILDHFIENKNTDKLNFWVGEFKKGFLLFPKDTIEKTEIILGNLLFMQYQELAKKGDRLAAAKGFEALFVHKLYPDKVKYQAAFFAAMVYLELGETLKSFHWQELAHSKMSEIEKLQRREEQMVMSERTYKLQDFTTSYKLSTFLLSKFCHLKDATQNRLFEISIMTALVNEKPLDAEKVVSTSSKCLNNVSVKESGLSQIYNFYEKKGDFFGLRLFVKRNPISPYVNQYKMSLQKWYWEKDDVNLKHHIRSEFRDLKNPETLRWLEEINLYKLAIKDLSEIKAIKIWDRRNFDGDVFNKSLEVYLLKLKAFKDNYQRLTQSTQTDLSIISGRHFSDIYSHVGDEIKALRPQGMDAKTMKEFQLAMNQLSEQFAKVSKQYDSTLEKYLSEKESLLWGARAIASFEEVENPVFSFYTGLTMDRSRE